MSRYIRIIYLHLSEYHQNPQILHEFNLDTFVINIFSPYIAYIAKFSSFTTFFEILDDSNPSNSPTYSTYFPPPSLPAIPVIFCSDEGRLRLQRSTSVHPERRRGGRDARPRKRYTRGRLIFAHGAKPDWYRSHSSHSRHTYSHPHQGEREGNPSPSNSFSNPPPPRKFSPSPVWGGSPSFNSADAIGHCSQRFMTIRRYDKCARIECAQPQCE